MKVLLLTGIGSVGDVYPFIGLGVALKARGHRVTLGASGYFRQDATNAGLDFAQLGPADVPNLYYSKSKWFRETAMPLVLNDTYRLINEQLEPEDTVVIAALGTIGAAVAHEKLGVPVAYVGVTPSYVHRTLNPLRGRTGSMSLWLYDRIYHPRTQPDALRSQLGLLPMNFADWLQWCRSPGPVVGLFPSWFAPSRARWLDDVSLTEFSLYDGSDGWTPSPELMGFMEESDPPLVFARSSWVRLSPRAISGAIAACRMLGRRCIFVNAQDIARPQQLPGGVAFFGYVPFSWLLPRSSAVIHNGGVGTAAHALAAGTPQLVVPLDRFQALDSRILRDLGVALRYRPLLPGASGLATTLDELLTSSEVAANCRAAADRMARSVAMPNACEAVEEVALGGGKAV